MLGALIISLLSWHGFSPWIVLWNVGKEAVKSFQVFVCLFSNLACVLLLAYPLWVTQVGAIVASLTATTSQTTLVGNG